MENQLNRTSSVLILSLIGALERFSYYGLKLIMVSFLVDGILNTPIDYASMILGVFLFLLGTLPFLFGLLTDYIFKQEKAVLGGGMISLLGYLILFIPNIYSFCIGLCLIATGSSLVRTNNTILLGRLFDKKESRRNSAFMILFAVINVFSFITTILTGYIIFDFGIYPSLIITALATFIYLLLFYIFKDRFIYIEKDLQNSKEQTFDDNKDILDSGLISKKNRVNNSIIFIFICLLSIFYWNAKETINSSQISSILSFDGLSFFNIEIDNYGIQIMNGYIYLPLAVITCLIWYFIKKGYTIFSFAAAILLLAIPGIIAYFSSNTFPKEEIMQYSVIAFAMIAISEIIFNAYSISYLTRISSFQYSSTIYGLFILISYILKSIFININIQINERELLIYIVLILITGSLILAFKKTLVEFTNGID